MPEKHTTSEQTIPKIKQVIIDEAKRIEENCLITAKGHFAAAQFWRDFNFWIGIPTAILSAIAGTSALTQFSYHITVAAMLSILVAALVAIKTFLNPTEKANAHLKAGNNYDALQSKVRIFWTIESPREMSEKLLTEKLKDLSEERYKLNKDSPQVSTRAYKRARRGIKKGEATYEVDQLKSKS